MTGLAVIPLVYLTLGLVPGWAGPGPAWGLWIALAIVATILVLDFAVAPGRGLTRRSHLVRP